jgi:signal transduction protein with GAF and PtsI domain
MKGVGLQCPVLELGQAYVIDGFDEWRRAVRMTASDPIVEKDRLSLAFQRSPREEITVYRNTSANWLAKTTGRFCKPQLMIMQDRHIERVGKSIDSGASAEGALFATLDQYVAAFARITTPTIRTRLDIKDVFYRLLWQLRERPTTAAGDNVVLVSRSISDGTFRWT